MIKPTLPRRRVYPRPDAPLLILAAVCCGGVTGAQSVSRRHTAPAPPKTAVAPGGRLAYAFKVGETRRYRLAAFFVGHFPPIALEGNPPANLEADILYVMTVRKVDAKGAEVEFVAENADVYLLEKDPGPNVTVKEDDKIPVPVSLEQIQKALNVTALIQPSGAVATVSGGDNSPIKVDIGFDLRKMFLTILPVVFPPTSVRPGDTWAFDDGVLGHKPGATTYRATLETRSGIGPIVVSENGQTVIANRLDKEGNATEKPADQVGMLTGKVEAVGRVVYGVSGAAGLHVTESRLNLVAQLKRVLPDPAAPGKTAETNIDVKARLVVKNVPPATKKAAAPARLKEKP